MASKAVTNTASKDSQNLGAPNQTLYVTNLDEKVNKDDLKRALYMLFSTFGPVLDIVTMRKGKKGQSMRGQAHVVFRDIQTSTQAMRGLQGFDFLGKNLKIVYAKGQSQIIPKLRGTFEAPAGAAPASGMTEVQKSIFNAPPSSIPTKPVENGISTTETTAEKLPHGIKRPREEDDAAAAAAEEEEEEDEEQSDASMDEDEDDAPMEEDDEDD